MSAVEQLPLVANHRPGAPLSWRDGQPVAWEVFVAEAQALAARLPPHTYVLNLCDDRHAFTVAFAAAILRGQINLLPPNRSIEVIREIAREYADSYFYRGVVRAGIGQYAASQADLQRYLVKAPEGQWSNNARSLLAQVTNALETPSTTVGTPSTTK